MELSFLAAAINSYNKKKGGMHLVFSPTLPDALPGRERCLTREEAARLLWAAWRARQKNRGGEDGRYVGKHVARFVLVGLYTGTRAGGDLWRGAYACHRPRLRRSRKRRVPPEGTRRTRHQQAATDRRHPAQTARAHAPLAAAGISNHSVIEWCGKPIKNVRRGFVAARDAAGLDDKVIPHTLRHTAVSWYLAEGVPTSVVADYVGMSEHILRKVYKHMLPGRFNSVMDAAHGFGRIGGNRVHGANSRHPFVTRTGEQETNKARRNEAVITEKKRENR